MGVNKDNFQINSEEFSNTIIKNSISSLDNRIEVLKSLASALFREVESLQNISKVQKKNKSSDRLDLLREVKQFEIDLIRTALLQTNWHQRKAAEMLGIKFTTLNSKIKRFEIELGKVKANKKYLFVD